MRTETDHTQLVRSVSTEERSSATSLSLSFCSVCCFFVFGDVWDKAPRHVCIFYPFQDNKLDVLLTRDVVAPYGAYKLPVDEKRKQIVSRTNLSYFYYCNRNRNREKAEGRAYQFSSQQEIARNKLAHGGSKLCEKGKPGKK